MGASLRPCARIRMGCLEAQLPGKVRSQAGAWEREQTSIQRQAVVVSGQR